jgi:hypothetical protein
VPFALFAPFAPFAFLHPLKDPHNPVEVARHMDTLTSIV